MTANIVEIKALPSHHLWLAFDDGRKGTVDLTEIIWGPVFAPLAEQDYFNRAYLDNSLGTVCWPNGADIAPETLSTMLMQDPR